MTASIVILAGHDDQAAGTSETQPIGQINYGRFNPATGRPDSAPPPRREQPLQTGSRRHSAPDDDLRGPGFSTD